MLDPKVYVTQYHPRLNFSPAKKFGEIVFMTERDFKPDMGTQPQWVEEENTRVSNEIGESLIEYLPGHDYLLITGNLMTALVTGQYLAKRFNSEIKHKVLKWNNRSHDYDVYEI